MTNHDQLEKLVFIVTGATGGIGGAVARALVHHGAFVIVTGRHKQRLRELVTELNSDGEMAFGIPIDLCAKGSIEQLVSAALKWKDVLDGLILCAGGARFTFFQRLTKQDFDNALQLNLLANVDLVRESLPHLIIRPSSWIIFINSIASREPAPPRGTAYLAAKSGLRFFADGLFSEVRDRGIRISSILPDLTDTPMVPEELGYNRYALIRPESIARTVIFALTVAADACITEVHVRPQMSTQFSKRY